MKRKPKSNRKKLENELDKVCSMVVKERDVVCQRCGSSKALAAHHAFGRRHMSVRWDLTNLSCLCWPCHKHFAHGDPLGFATWYCEKIGMGEYEKLSWRAKSICKRNEFDLAYLLSERKKQLNEATVKGTADSGIHHSDSSNQKTQSPYLPDRTISRRP